MENLLNDDFEINFDAFIEICRQDEIIDDIEATLGEAGRAAIAEIEFAFGETA